MERNMSVASEEETNFARVCQITIDLYPQALRDYLQSMIDPATLPLKVKLKRNYNAKLSAEQRSILHDLRIDKNYDRCDTTLLYILYRNFPCMSDKPTKGWGNPVDDMNVNVCDDLERIRESRNCIFGHVDRATLTNAEFADFVREARDILGRFDNRCASKSGAGSYVTKLNAIEAKVMDSNAYDYFKNELTKAKADEVALAKKIQDIEKDQATLTGSVLTIQSKLSKSEDSIFHIETKQVSFEGTISTLQSKVSQSETDLANFQRTQSQINHRILQRINEKQVQISPISLNQKTSDEFDKKKRSEIFTDDGTNHCECINGTSWYIWAHHSEEQNPSTPLHSYKRELYITEKIQYKLYDCGETRFYDIDELNGIFLEKFKSIFSIQMNDQPWLLTNLHNDCVENKNFYEFCEKIQSWSRRHNYSFLFIDFKYEENLLQLKFDLELLKKNLDIEKEDSTSRVLLYLAERQMIFNIRFVQCDSESENLENLIINGIHQGQNDAKLFSALYMDLLKDNGICFTSVVALDGASVKDLDEMKLCKACDKNLIVFSDDLQDQEMLARKFGSLLKERIESFDGKLNSSGVKKLYERFASRIWASLCVKDVHLPVLSSHDQNTLVPVYLNNEQRRFLHYRYNAIVLQGGYGSGKSILAQEKFKELAIHAAPNDQLYFIVFSDETIYTSMVRTHIHASLPTYISKDQVHVMNLEQYSKKYIPIRENESVSVSRLLSSLRRRSDGSLIVVIDELDTSIVTEWEAALIEKEISYYKSHGHYVLMVTQSMEVSRTIVQKKGVPEKEKEEYVGHLKSVTGLEIIQLNNIMRNSTKINELSREALKILKHHANRYLERKVEDVISFEEGTGNTRDRPFELSRSASLKTLRSNFDHCAKTLSSHAGGYTGRTVKSTFHFPGEWSNGHLIKGSTPKLIYPFGKDFVDYRNVNRAENKKRISYVLENIIEIQNHVGDLAVIAFDPIDAQFIREALTAMRVPVVLHAPALLLESIKTHDELRDSMKNNILITDHVGARGMEFKRLVVAFNPNEVLLQQFLIEAFTRAIFELSFLLIYKDGGKLKENSIWGKLNIGKRIIKKWIKKELVKVYEVSICRLHKSERSTVEVCCLEDERIHHIHPWHEDFQNCELMSTVVEKAVDSTRALEEYNNYFSRYRVDFNEKRKMEENKYNRDSRRSRRSLGSIGDKSRSLRSLGSATSLVNDQGQRSVDNHFYGSTSTMSTISDGPVDTDAPMEFRSQSDLTLLKRWKSSWSAL